MNDELLNRLRNVSNLPSLPAVALRVLELVRRDDVRIADVANVISSDSALSAKLLRTVNSSFYGLSKQVGTISHAATLLGLQSVKTLALGFSLVSIVQARPGEAFDFSRFWRQSLYTAVAARLLANRVAPKQREEAFVAGLLSDVGTLVMHRAIGREYDELLAASNGNQIELVRLSRERFDLDHAQVGAMLAEHWQLPPLLVEMIRQHHNLDDPAVKSRSLVEVVHVGVICAQVFAAGVNGLLQSARYELQSRFALDEGAILDLFAQIDARSQELAQTFDLRIETGRTIADIEEEARHMLVELTLQSQMQSRAAKQLNKELQLRANSDGLTKLANRARLNQFLSNAFTRCQIARQPLALLFLDLDRFKAVNDRYGHQGGDQVLTHLAKLLLSQIRLSDLAARYGGEEFAVVLPGLDADAAGRVAERIRQAVAAARVEFNGATIEVTASIGVAATSAVAVPGADAMTSAAELIKAADDCLYAAKADGRNCVRQSTPDLRAAG
jgi:two-component system cell cycle response regulator